MRYCKKCVMPDTRPNILFDEEGVCSACKNYENRKNIDWDKRWRQLEAVADKYRGCNGNYYDCIITGSAGKDTYYQVHIFKEVLKMNPLLLSVNNFTWTKTGKRNWKNLLNEFGIDAVRLTQNPRACKRMFAKGLEKGVPTWYFDFAIYAWPLYMATKLKIPLVVYGENVNYEYGGINKEDQPSALNQINNDAVRPIPTEEWIDNEIEEKDFACCRYPTEEEIKNSKLNPIYLSYYVPWSGYKNMEFARNRGFRTLSDTNEWERKGFLEQYDQIDTVGYLVHSWFKFVKYGHFRVTDVASIWIREGRMTREEAVKKVISEDWKLDKKMLKDFLMYIGYTEEEFWKIVEKHANRNIIEKRNNNWRLKENIVEALKKGGKAE